VRHWREGKSGTVQLFQGALVCSGDSMSFGDGFEGNEACGEKCYRTLRSP
jgi:hypothetical protein